MISNGVISTRFLGAMEPTERGASGLMEAVGRSLEQPADPSSHLLCCLDDQNHVDDNETENNDLLADIKMPDFTAPIFNKVLSLSQGLF